MASSRYRVTPAQIGNSSVLRLPADFWLGFPRKEGDRNDCYAVFQQMVRRGDLPKDWESLEAELDGP
jgi:hypothetical protein